MIFCPKCGTGNDEDAKFCEKCGKILKKDIHSKNISKIEKKDGMSKLTKTLVVLCVVLVAAVGLTAGMLLQKPGTNTTVYQVLPTSQAPQETQSQQYQPTWHQVSSFSGTTQDSRSFNIKGNQFKVTMSAVPMITYNANYLDVYVYSGNYIVGSGSLSWGSKENPNRKEHVIPVSRGPGVYSLNMAPIDLESYTVTVWDYY